jgi:DNA-directed RNA polymerase subunit RPC12/RpoP
MNKKYSKKCLICGKIFSTNREQQILCGDYSCKRKYALMRYYMFYDTPDGERITYLKTRWEILQRDNFACQYCGRTPQDGAKLQVDHIIPKSRGGTNEKENLITACLECNLGKFDVLLEERHVKKHFKHV